MRKLIFPIIFLVLVIFTIIFVFLRLNDKNDIPDKGEENKMNEIIKVNIEINGNTYKATLEDNETTKELLNLLPLEINMDELNGNEKYHYLDETLPTNQTKINKINNGDIMLYGNSCLVIFYDTFNTSYQYTKIGKIDNPSNLKKDLGKGSAVVKITKE